MRSHPSLTRRRRGQVLVEFALIALVLYLLLATTLEMGRALFAGQALQQAADTAARELSRTPLPPTGTLAEALDTPQGRQIYDPQYLVLDLAAVPPGKSVQDHTAGWPLLNRLLVPLMVSDPENNRLHYPGRVHADPKTGKLTVDVPVVSYGGGTDSVVEYLPVVEEVTAQPGDPEASPFSLTAAKVPEGQRGFIALRINYPFQAASLSAYDPDTKKPVEAGPGAGFGTYAGPDGLGRQAALGKAVRPFRRVLSFQAVYRRELIGQ